jgi:uncharacterized membrane protein YciS (DUF1049 family)
MKKVFDYSHARGRYLSHLKHASFIAGLFIGAGLLGLVHAVTRVFLPEILSGGQQKDW